MKTTRTRVICVFCISIFVLMYNWMYIGLNKGFVMLHAVDRDWGSQKDTVKQALPRRKNKEINPYVPEAHWSRFMHLRDACKSRDKFEPSHFRTQFHPSRTTGYCRVNKCASVFVKEVLEHGTGCSLKCLRNATEKMVYREKKRLMKNVFTFMFVRDPFSRLFAYYCNRFFTATSRWNRDDFGRKSIHRFRDNPTKLSLNYSFDLTFSEFLKNVVNSFETTGSIKDEHIRPMTTGCDPCSHNFSFIGKLETFNEDLTYLFEGLNKSGVLYHGIDPKSLTNDINKRLLRRPFIALNRSIIHTEGSPFTRYYLYSRTWAYFQILGRISIEYSLPLSREEAEYTSVPVFEQTMMDFCQRSLSDAVVKRQKLEAMAQAYSAVPMDIRLRLNSFLQTDCDMFDYDCSPDFVFKPDDLLNPTFDYFKAMHLKYD